MEPGVCWCLVSAVLLLVSGVLVSGEQVASVEVLVRERSGVSTVPLQGQLVEASLDSINNNNKDNINNNNKVPGKHKLPEPDLEGDLVLVQDEGQVGLREADEERWIGVVPVDVEERQTPTGNQESFAAAVVNKMKRALVLGASALIILALNQNTVREMDLSQVISKPVIIIQTSENVTKLIGALLRGLQATAKITYKTILQDNLGATLTLWSTCGRSRGGLYGEWQGVICTGETTSQVQKYLQQLWNTVLMVGLVLCTGVVVQARWQYQESQLSDELEMLLKQAVEERLSSLKTRIYRQPSRWCDPALPAETDNCAVCLEPFNNNQCVRVLPCLHEFHQDCVDPWLLLQPTCPLCKRSILCNLCRDS